MIRMARGRARDPLCPFCSKPFDRPQDITAKLGNVFTGGRCECGAVYVYDRTERSLGEAYVDGLVYACDGDWDAAWKLTPEVDYIIESLHYDIGSHTLTSGGKKVGRAGENLLFIHLKNKLGSDK